MSNGSNGKLTKSERREKAREQARLAREQQRKKERRRGLLIKLGVIVAIIAVAGTVVLVNNLNSGKNTVANAPKNMQSGGFIVGKDLEPITSPALKPEEKFKAFEYDPATAPLHVVVYGDYMCPACAYFEEAYGSMLEQYVGAGDITLEMYPLNFLDSTSNGTKYSTRAANTVACLADQQPEHAYSLHKKLFSKEVQPQEHTTGLTDKELLEQAKAAGAKLDDKLKSCVKDKHFAGFIDKTNKGAFEGIVAVAEGETLLADYQTGEMQKAEDPQRVISTPTVLVNGKQWIQERDGELEAFIQKQLQNLGGGDTTDTNDNEDEKKEN